MPWPREGRVPEDPGRRARRAARGGFLAFGLAAWRLAALTTAAEPLPPLRWAADAKGGAPYVFRDPKAPGRHVGFEVDLAEALQEELGRRIEFVQYAFKSLVSGLKRGDFDFAMAVRAVGGRSCPANRGERASIGLQARPWGSWWGAACVILDRGEVVRWTCDSALRFVLILTKKT